MPKTTAPQRKTPSRQAVLRAVASSTAVETGRSVEQHDVANRSGLARQHPPDGLRGQGDFRHEKDRLFTHCQRMIDRP